MDDPLPPLPLLLPLSLLPELPVPGAAATPAAPTSVIAAATVMVVATVRPARIPILFVTNMFASQIIETIRRIRAWQNPHDAGIGRSSDNGRPRPVVVVVGLILGVAAAKRVTIRACALARRGSIG
ncbi:hypothetical protein OG935_06110 [Nocardia cyriacigeorgica]|uniref:hypothetical protein n=1 Tax=Nocardia cyriacigeorgica TaxID=135487 RepID=UPI002157A2FE|nr:hypothetical protein [Nocardia cyriacigeorgica]